VVELTEAGGPSVLCQCLRQAEVQRRRGVRIALTGLTEFSRFVCMRMYVCTSAGTSACARERGRDFCVNIVSTPTSA